MTGAESVCSIVRELREDVAAYPHPHSSGVVSVSTGYVWLLGNQAIRLDDSLGSSHIHLSHLRLRVPSEILQRVRTYGSRGGLP